MKYLAVDVDDTLSQTARAVAAKMLNAGIDSEKVSQTLKTYGFPSLVPEWQGEKEQTKIKKLYEDPNFLAKVPTVEGAVEALNDLPPGFRVGLYLTSRLHEYRPVTEAWLTKHVFPKGPVITRAPHQFDRNWKTKLLAGYQPAIYGLIDDDREALEQRAAGYMGRLFWFDPLKRPYLPIPGINRFDNWQQFLIQLKVMEPVVQMI